MQHPSRHEWTHGTHGLGCGGGIDITLLELASMVDATKLMGWSGGENDITFSFNLETWSSCEGGEMITFLEFANVVHAMYDSWGGNS